MSAPSLLRSLLLARPAAQQVALALHQQASHLQQPSEQRGWLLLSGPCSGTGRLWSQSSSREASTASTSSSTPSASSSHAQAMQLATALASPAHSLAFERPAIWLPPPLNNKAGHYLLYMLGFYSPKSRLLHGGQTLYAAVREQCDDGALIKAFGLDPNVFFSTYILLSLHVWLVIHRLGPHTDAASKDFKQRFYNNFQYDVEHRVNKSVSVGVSKWLKQLETVFYSSGLSFDKVLSGESKETFTDVILRHHFGNDATKKSQAALLAKYVQREMHCLQLTDEDSIIKGHVKFSQEPFMGLRTAAATDKQRVV